LEWQRYFYFTFLTTLNKFLLDELIIVRHIIIIIIIIIISPYSYGLDDRGSRVRFPAEAGNFSPNHRVQHFSGAHPASYPMGTVGSFPWGKAAGA
jgi:hypothetical protein